MLDNTLMVRTCLPRQARAGLLLGAALLLAVLPALGQNTDVNVNLYGTLPQGASAGPLNPGDPPLKETQDSSLGFRMGLRHIFNPKFGLEINFGYNRATQHFQGNDQQTGVVFSHAKPFTIDYVASVPFSIHGIRPFLLAGGGLISYNISSYVAKPPPNAPALPARPIKVPVFEYGIGADFHPGMLPPFLALRLQYRGLVGHAPDYRNPILSTNNLRNIAEPQAGLVFRF
jgi:hypothetical protein